jgi:hypothetical protein
MKPYIYHMPSVRPAARRRAIIMLSLWGASALVSIATLSAIYRAFQCPQP